MNNIILSKSSSMEAVERYFRNVLELENTGVEFPIKLEAVWGIAFSQKRDAMRQLQSNQFIEGIDFEICQNGKVVSINNLQNGKKTEVKISVSCMEFLIARKVRNVFEVYRKVFHHVANGMQTLPNFNDPVAAARAWADEKEKSLKLEAENVERQKKLEKQQPFVDFAKNAFQSESKVDIGQAAKILSLPFGRNTLFQKLRNDGVFFKDRNEPKQKFIEAKYFTITQLNPIYTDGGREIIRVKVFCTQKGLAYINYLYGSGRKELPEPQKTAAIG